MDKITLSILCGTVSLFASTAALAQSQSNTLPAAEPQSSEGLETIVVTARKRVESMQDIPVSVSAISKIQLQNNAVTELNKIGEIAPQVMIGRATTGTGAVLTIRGISSAPSDSGLDQSVSVDMDGVALSRGRIIESGMFDLQQVEVLQGPQALFFGKNSPAGVISVQTADPTNSFAATVRAGYEFTANERYIEANIGGPVSDTLKVRLAARYDKMDGWIRNVAAAIANPFQPAFPLPGNTQGDRLPAGHEVGGRLTLLWDPSDDFSAKFKLTGTSQRLNSNSGYSETYCGAGQTVPLTLGVAQPNGDCKIDKTVAMTANAPGLTINYPYINGGVPYSSSDLALASLALTKTMGDISLTSTTGYYYQTHSGSHVGDYGAFSQIADSEHEVFKQVNEELRLNTDFDGPLNGMIGGYYEHTQRNWLNAPDILHVFDPVAQNYATTITTSDNRNDSYSGFAQLRWKIAPTLELDGGARYTHDIKRSTLLNTQTNLASATGRTLRAQGLPLLSRYTGNNTSPEVTLTWKPERDQTIYVAYKVGYKAGGISNAALLPATSTSENIKFQPEKAKGFEGGYKAYFFDHTLRFDLTAYRYAYNGLQVTAYDSVAVRFSIRNAAKARTTGLTGSFDWKATDALSFNGNFGYNRARYLSFTNAQCYVGQTVATGCVPLTTGGTAQNLSGKALNRAPKLTFKLGADYKAELPGGWTADLSTSAAHTSAYFTAADYSGAGPQDAYWLVNAGIHLMPANERFRISLIGRNLTDTFYKVISNNQSLGTVNQYASSFNRPREVILQAEVRF